MKAPIKWLRDYVDINMTAEELAEKLLRSGFEVEEIINLADSIKNVVVGKITRTEKHPNADKLTICQVQISEKGKTVQIVTAATNVAKGDYVPVALDGAVLPSGKTILAGELRGVKSDGMMCGGSELDVTDADYQGAGVDGIMLLKDVETLTLGQNINEVLGLDCQVLDISVTANRPDCQSIFGMAREVAGILGKQVKMPSTNFRQTTNDNISDILQVDVQAKDLCPRYIARVVKDIKIEQSPKFIKDRLRWCGIRSINNIVDITNFILLELGQPMHAFDLQDIKGNKIVVRRAKENEKITTLDSKERLLNKEMLVIADGSRAVGIAGVMGGENSEIKEQTKAVAFECAKFNRQSIRRTSKQLGLKTDASAMYERGVSAYTAKLASDRALNLIDSLKAGTIVSGIIDINSENGVEKVIEVKTSQIDEVLGIKIAPKKMVEYLNSLNIKTTLIGDKLKCVIPSYRDDIDRYPDIAEEIIRLNTYEKFEGTLLTNAEILNGGYSQKQKTINDVENELIANGFNEIITYSFISEKMFDGLMLDSKSPLRKCIKLINPLSEDIAVMRTTLVPSMLKTLATNINKKNEEANLFEIANVYIANKLPLIDKLPSEFNTLCLGSYGSECDFFSMKGAVNGIISKMGFEIELKRSELNYMHGGRSADIFVNGKKVGYFGEVHPTVCENFEIQKRCYVAEINLNAIMENSRKALCYKDIPRFQNSYRDLAFVVKSQVTCAEIESIIKANATEICESISLFDVYMGSQIEAGYKSMAFKINFRAKDRTLKDSEIEPIMSAIISKLESQVGAVLRK